MKHIDENNPRRRGTRGPKGQTNAYEAMFKGTNQMRNTEPESMINHVNFLAKFNEETELMWKSRDVEFLAKFNTQIETVLRSRDVR